MKLSRILWGLPRDRPSCVSFIMCAENLSLLGFPWDPKSRFNQKSVKMQNKGKLSSKTKQSQGSLSFPDGSTVNICPPMQEIQVWSLDREDPLEKKMATHSSIFAWEIPWTEGPGGLVNGVAKNQTRLKWLTLSLFSSIYILLQEADFPGAAARSLNIDFVHPVSRFMLLDFIHCTYVYHS